jgi:hypothetical protein
VKPGVSSTAAKVSCMVFKVGEHDIITMYLEIGRSPGPRNYRCHPGSFLQQGYLLFRYSEVEIAVTGRVTRLICGPGNKAQVPSLSTVA